MSVNINDRKCTSAKHQGVRKIEEREKSAKNLGARKRAGKIKERGSAKAQNLRPKKERESASAKSSAKERESASAKRKKKRVPSSGCW